MTKRQNKKLLIASIILAAVLIIVALGSWRWRNQCQLRLSQDGCIVLEIASTHEARTKGLSNRDQLPVGQGMLFTFNKPGSYCFWMKDMSFSIDMIWLNSSGKITTLEPNVLPQTYPRFYCGTSDVVKVLELPAGSIQRNQLNAGNPLML